MELLYTLTLYPIELLMQQVLEWGFVKTHHYGYALIILSLVVNILLLPIYYQAERWRNADKLIQAKMRPMLDSIKLNYQGTERYYYTQALYRLHNYSPASSVKASAGFLIQIPFFFAAFHLLSNYEPLVGVSFGIFKDLGAPDALLGGINAMPFVMTIINLAAAYIYIKNYDQKEKYQLWGMALLFLVILYNEPAGLLLYWTLNNLFSFGKNVVETRVNKSWWISAKQKLKNINERLEGVSLSNKKLLLFVIVSFVIFGFLLHIALDGFNFRAVRKQEADYFYLALSVILLISINIQLGFGLKIRKKLNATYSVCLLLGAGISFYLVYSLFTKSFVSHEWVFTSFILQTLLLLISSSIYLFNTNKNNSFKIKIGYIANIWLAILSIIFLVNPVYLYNIEPNKNILLLSIIEFGVFNLYICLIVLLLVFKGLRESGRSIFYKLSVNVFILFFIYSFFIKYNFGVLDEFEFVNESLLAIPKSIKIIELVLISIVAIYLWKKAEQNKEIIFKFTALTNLIFFAYLANASIFSDEGIKADIQVADQIELIPDASVASFSQDKNILVLFLDAFSGGMIQKIINEKPQLLENYTGFTWYRNALSTSVLTAPSAAALVGGHKYTLDALENTDYESINQVMREAYSVWPNALKEQNFKIDYFSPPFIEKDNLDKSVSLSDFDYAGYYLEKYENKPLDELFGDTESELKSSYLSLSLFQSMPLSLRKKIYNKGKWLSNPLSVSTKNLNRIIKKAHSWGFLVSFVDMVNTDIEHKTFKYLVLESPHTPYIVNDEGKLDPETASYWIESYKLIEKIGEMISKLKELGAYENTKIILVSDHGQSLKDATLGMNKGFHNKVVLDSTLTEQGRGSTYPLLMVKDFQKSNNFEISDTFVSNADLASIVCSAIEEGCAIPDLDPTKIKLDRKLKVNNFTYDKFNMNKKYIKKQTYEVKNNIFEPDNWELINND